MKLSILGTVALGLSAFVPVGLWAQDQIRTTIPFEFNIGSKVLPAGEYVVWQSGSKILSIQNVDRKTNTLVLVNTSYKHTQDGRAYLIFNKYGNHHFLSRISQPEDAWEFPKGRQEKEMIAKVAAQPVNLVATK